MYPKQLLPLAGEKTMLQATALRLDGLPNRSGSTLVVCNESHRFSVAEQLAGCEIKPLLAENQQEDRATRRDRKLRPPGFERRPVGFQRAERAVLRDRNTARRGGRPLR